MTRSGFPLPILAPVLALAFTLATGCGGDAPPPPADEAPPAATGTDVTLHVPFTQRAALVLSYDTVRAGTSTRAIQVPATVIPDPAHEARVSSLIAGRLSTVRAAVGARVERGAELAVVESAEFGRMAAEFIRAHSDAATARAEYERALTLHGEQVSSVRQLEAARNEKVAADAGETAARAALTAIGCTDAELADLLAGGTPVDRIRAPIAGTVAARHATTGQTVGPDTPLFDLLATGSVTVEGSVFERDFAAVRTGQAVRFTARAYPDESFTGTVTSVGAVVDARTQALPVRCRLTNPRGLLRPNLHGTLEIASDIPRPVLTVSLDAVAYDGSARYVFIPASDSTFVYRRIETGPEAGGRVEVRTGLAPGDVTVATGVFQLKSLLKLEPEE